MADVQFSGPIYDQPPPQVIHFDETLPPQGPKLPWVDATGKADGAMAKKFLLNYLTAVQSDLKNLKIVSYLIL
jgi:hypothetical protein